MLIVPNPCFRLMITECVFHRFGMRDMQWGPTIPTGASMPRGGPGQVAARRRRGERTNQLLTVPSGRTCREGDKMNEIDEKITYQVHTCCGDCGGISRYRVYILYTESE